MRRGGARRGPGRPASSSAASCCAPDQRAARSAARTDMPWRDDLAREPAPLVVVRDGEHGAGVALRELAALDHREHVVGQLEQPQSCSRSPASSGRRARPPRRARARTRPSAARSRAPPRSARGSRGRRSRPGRAAACRGRPPRGSPPARVGEARLARRAPAALAGDQLVAALEPRPEHDRLDRRPARGSSRRGRRSPRDRSAARLARVRVDLLDRHVRELGLGVAPPIRTSKPRPRPRRGLASAAFDKLHRHLPVGLGAARAPVVVGDRQAVARRLGDAHRARHDRARRRDRRSAGAPRARRRPRASCGRRSS